MYQVTKTSLAKTKTGYQLMVDDQPFYIKGAGLEFGNIPDAANHGANSIRTWRVENGQKTGKEVLDEAHAQGLKVMMGIEVARERHGFDYDDEEAVRKQLERIRKEVQLHKDHPALILWGIGNELNLEGENPKVWDAVNEISMMIHEEDPHHLTTTSLAGLDEELSDLIVKRAHDLDILSVQLYGDITTLPRTLKKVSWKGPIIVSEWGATGYWEVKKTKWGAPIEEHSSKKAKSYLTRYQSSILDLGDQCLGSYVFLWGQKQERTSTWFGLYTEHGKKTETVNVMHYLWNGHWPEASCPKVRSFTLNGKPAEKGVKLQPQQSYKAVFELESSESVRYYWALLRESTASESGGDVEEVPETISSADETSDTFQIQAPAEKGNYRLYAYADTESGYTAHANIPFQVI